VALVEVPSDLQLRRVEAEAVTVAGNEALPTDRAQPVTTVVPENRRGRGDGGDRGDVEVAGGAGVERGGDQRGLSRQRDADALQRDEQEQREVAVALPPAR